MSKLVSGARIQAEVLGALMIRELITRFGRENIGFLWIMAEPLLFAVLVGLVWRYSMGRRTSDRHGSVRGNGLHIPCVLFRTAFGRSVNALKINSSLLYHRRVKILDIVLVRFLIEMLGAMIAYVFIGVVLNRRSDYSPCPTTSACSSLDGCSIPFSSSLCAF